jgi:hypothetical protein
MNEIIMQIVHIIVVVVHPILIPTLMSVWLFGVVARLLVYYTVKRQEWMLHEFNKRVTRFIETEQGSGRPQSFYILAKKLLERTYYECFEMRAAMKRRRLDYIQAPSDRLFMVQEGAAWFVRDSLKNFRFLRKTDDDPKFIDIAKNIFRSNAPWNKVFGYIPAGPLNDMLNILPGLFIIGGIFGTFLGIMEALPSLGGMDLNDVEGSKRVMDAFLGNISFSMAASTMGMMYSVSFTLINALCNPSKVFFNTVNQAEATLNFLWGRCETNDVPPNVPKFDEHKDPIEALAELAVDKQLKNYDRGEPNRPNLPPAPKKQGESGEAKKEAS